MSFLKAKNSKMARSSILHLLAAAVAGALGLEIT